MYKLLQPKKKKHDTQYSRGITFVQRLGGNKIKTWYLTFTNVCNSGNALK